MIKHLFNGLHTVLARGPGGLARVYMESLGWSCRSVLPKALTARIQSSISQHTWPDMQFSAREVVVGDNTRIKIKPHLGEFDDVALFSSRLNYEDASFRWLEAHAASRYDVIIEIGANVGAFTVFFDALVRRGARLKSVIAFEPSREAYARLLSNLHANGASAALTFNAAVGAVPGFQTFYEPDGHLTNGSFQRDFSAIFSDTVRSTTVLTVAATDVASFIKAGQKALIKIDVEGYEPQLLEAMAGLINQHHPDLLIEVLPGIPEQLEKLDALSGYDRQLLTMDGLEPSPTLYASQTERDWLLTWPE